MSQGWPIQEDSSVGAVFARAIGHMRTGESQLAQSLLTSILERDPGNAESLHMLGVCMHFDGRYPDAERLISAALRIDPHCAGAYLSRGNALRSIGKIESALEDFSRACLLDPTLTDGHFNRALALAELQQTAAAIEAVERALELAPDDLEAQGLRTNLLQQQRRAALEMLVRNQAERSAPLLESYVQRQPDDAGVWNDLGVTCNRLGRFEQALAMFGRAIALTPEMAKAHSNLGNALYRVGRYADSEASYLRALQIDPDDHMSRWNLGLCRLVQGDLSQGWRDYEARWRQRDSVNFARRDFFDLPWWRGEQDLAGRTILLHAEQGLGDALQFSRYATMVVQRGAQVVLEVHEPLRPLMQRAFGASVVVVSRGEALPPFDLHCPLLSLPLAFGTTLENVPSRVPYLSASAQHLEQWQSKLGAKTRPRIGLVWSGGAHHPFDALRNVPLSALRELELCDVEFIALQPQVRETDRPALDRFRNLRWLGESIADFEDTAALVCLCDRVISVDTSVAHLAGALGRPLSILLPFAPDWRWLLGREDSPWYPTAHLLRQHEAGAWDPVVERLARNLAA
ncbi:MAG: tetratricopeptide repeat protein [Burkholderiaceae bacterium]|nr:tetratricopeptide repeat protein [Burkholderiaceae bacterium]